MKPMSEREIRGSFVNCSKGEAGRLPMMRGLAEVAWEDLDFFGWRDPGAPDRSYLVAERDGSPMGVAMRSPVRRGFLKRVMCSLCLTTHTGNGVSLMTARKAGLTGREGNTVGLYICTDLACSLYIRGKKLPGPGGRMEETLTVEEQAERVKARLTAFLDKVAD
jgi:hypothetical protein